MSSILPAARSLDALQLAAQAATTRYGGSYAAPSYFETTGSVRIGPYSGHLCYMPWPHGNGSMQVVAELDDAVQKQRGLCKKLFDKVFRGISLDGRKQMSETQARTFCMVDHLFNTTVHWIRSNSFDAARQDIDLMAASIEVMRNPSAALARIRAAGSQSGPAALADIVISMSVPIVAEAAWRDAATIRRLVGLCSNSSQILALAETGDPANQRNALAGLQRMLGDDATIQRIADTLADETRGMSFKDAYKLVLPFMVHGQHGSFVKDWAGRDRVPQLWIALRDTVATSEDAAGLANDQVMRGLAPYHRAMDFVLQDGQTSDRIRRSIIDRLLEGSAGSGPRIGMENAGKLATFLTGTPRGGSTRPGTILSRSALQLIWGDPVIAIAIDQTARDAMAPGGTIQPLQPLLRTHPNKAYVAQYCGVSPVIGVWSRMWTSRYGATEEIHAEGTRPPCAGAAPDTIAVARRLLWPACQPSSDRYPSASAQIALAHANA